MTQNESTPKIEMRDVKKSFGTKQVLNGIDLIIPKGESMVIIGGSGSGKSVTLMKVWENIAFGLMQGQKMERDEAREIAIEKLKQVGLAAQTAELYPAEISGGMQKRVSLARAIATNPEIIFFDEPTTGLDPIMADVINNLICECVKDLGATALTITHDMASARKIADEVSMIYEGQMIWNGPVGQLYDSGNSYVEQFIHGRAEGPITKHKSFKA
jgi:phospholipid/cholesterol/gamma-HCH transport system ATP-binding protein